MARELCSVEGVLTAHDEVAGVVGGMVRVALSGGDRWLARVVDSGVMPSWLARSGWVSVKSRLAALVRWSLGDRLAR